MDSRDFSDSVKLEIIKQNLEKYNGQIHCDLCKKQLNSINECHFDHIFPFAKGGKSTLSNCQILCVDCNLKKNDKLMQDFILEEKARRFLSGGDVNNIDTQTASDKKSTASSKMTKELFDQKVKAFIDKKGDIHKVDFSREYNNLPSIHYVHIYYGDINNLKKAFGIIDLSNNWDRESIKNAICNYLKENNEIAQKDLTKSNNLPSLPCILKYYPEYKNFTDIKKYLCNLEVQEPWNVENCIKAGKEFIKTHRIITQKDFSSANHLPTMKVIVRLFGSLENYQKSIGSEITKRNTLISKNDIQNAVETFFGNDNRIIDSQNAFFESFPYSPSTIYKRYGSFSEFCNEYGITVINAKKAKYTKREVDDAICNWVKNGNTIPLAKELSSKGLPSLSVILKYYENWKEPFLLYQKIVEEIKR
ncbi:MAG: HNH endonuclease [Acutalibacteraceae bacterium]